jgi:hypothetical protein
MRHTESRKKIIAWLESKDGEAWRLNTLQQVRHNIDMNHYGGEIMSFKPDNESPCDVDYYDDNGYLIGYLHHASNEDWFDPCGMPPIDQEEKKWQLNLSST